MKNENKPTTITFGRLMDFIECEEEAEILLNEKRYSIGFKVYDKKVGLKNYFVNEKTFSNKKDFIDFIYNDSLIQLTNNSVINLISIGGGVSVDESWFKEEKENQNLTEENHKHVLYRNILIRFCFTLIILSFAILYLINNTKTEYLLIFVVAYSIIFLPKNIKRLKILLRYTKKEVNELEERIKGVEEGNCFTNIYLLDSFLIKLEKSYFEVINYNDIGLIFRELYYSRRGLSTDKFNPWFGYKQYGEFIFITKDKKVHKMGYISKEKVFKEKILEKNTNILFGITNSIITEAKQLYRLNIKSINFKNHIIDYVRIVCFLVMGYVIFHS